MYLNWIFLKHFLQSVTFLGYFVWGLGGKKCFCKVGGVKNLMKFWEASNLILDTHIPDPWPMSGFSLSVCEALVFVGCWLFWRMDLFCFKWRLLDLFLFSMEAGGPFLFSMEAGGPFCFGCWLFGSWEALGQFCRCFQMVWIVPKFYQCKNE